MSVTTLITADELLRMPDDGCRYELVAGEIKKCRLPVGDMAVSRCESA